MNSLSTYSNNFYSRNLVEFGKLPDNTNIHWDEEADCFLLTTKDFIGNNTPEDTVKHIKKFAEKLIEEFGKYGESNAERIKKIEEAISGKDGCSGLLGLAITYNQHSEKLSQEIVAVIENLQKITTKTFKGATIPEELFTDKDWEKAIVTSENLPIENVDLSKYLLQYRLTRGLNDLLNTADWSLHNINQKVLGNEYNLSKNWWEKIGHFKEGDLYLGAIPISKIFGRNDLDELYKLGINAVLSVVEVFENHDEGWVTSTITPKQWREKGIKQLQLPSPDKQTVSIDLIERGVEFIHWNLKNGRNVYVHCNLGRGRSFLVEACYLIKHHDMSALQAFQKIKNGRSQSGFSNDDPKWITLKEYEKSYRSD